MSSPKAFTLDLALLPQTTLEAWEEQATYIQDHMSAEVIDAAFAHFPKEIRDETIDEIKQALLKRKDDLVNYAREYYGVISKKSIVTGTNKDDYFTVTSLSNGNRLVVGQRIKGGEKADIFFKKEYDRDLTKEVWLYGLDDDDVFEVTGKSPIKVRLIGGQNNDTYKVDGNKVYVYDFKDKKNDYSQAKKARRIRRTRDYETNIYSLEELHYNTNQFIPSIGANPDDGLRIGFSNIYTVNGIERNPVPAQHILNGAFYFATQGFDLRYRGEFSNVIGHANLQLKAAFTSPNFAMNFFGFGNETLNFDDDLELDHNRVKLQTLRFSSALLWRGRFGSRFTIGATYESIEIGDTDDRFIDQFVQDTNIDVENTFIGGDMEYSFDNRDNAAFPTLGMTTTLKLGYRSSTNDNGKSFGFVTPSLGIAHKLVPNGRLVLATKWKAHFNLGDDYEFYQAASIGGTDGLRGYRNQRFAGKTSYYQNTDLRYSFRKMRTGLVPTAVGLFGGFDYGRVWLPNEDSDEWHTSFGGGFFLNATDVFSMNLSAFNSDDGMRFVFGLGFGF